MRLVERDYGILREIGRWKFMLGRHIEKMCGFNTASACDKRLKVLITAGFIQRKKYIYGIPSLYTLTHKGKILSEYNKRQDNIRIDKIHHDICVLDVAIQLMNILNISTDYIITERELHSNDGFGVSKHYPDFVLLQNDKKLAVEIELSLKERKRFEKNIQDNYRNYATQIWVIPKQEKKIFEILDKSKISYTNIRIYYIEDLRKE